MLGRDVHGHIPTADLSLEQRAELSALGSEEGGTQAFNTAHSPTASTDEDVVARLRPT